MNRARRRHGPVYPGIRRDGGRARRHDVARRESERLAAVALEGSPRGSVGDVGGDRVAVFPREYIVFTDWKDFRF